MSERKGPKLKGKQIASLTGEAVLSSVPFAGPALATFTFGTLKELRLSRIESTLKEVMQGVGEENAKNAVNEKFVNLLETVAPELCRAADDEKRKRFRDLLINAASLPENSKEWSAAALAADLLKDIETPGLVILAAFAQLDEGETALLTAHPIPQLVRGVDPRAFDPENPGEPQHIIPYEWNVVDYWYRRLADLRLVIRGAHGRDTHEHVALFDLGKFLVRWALR